MQFWLKHFIGWLKGLSCNCWNVQGNCAQISNGLSISNCWQSVCYNMFSVTKC